MLTNDDKALILLCSHVGINNKDIKPLTLKQWNDLGYSIRNSNVKRPENLFNMNEEELTQELKLPIDSIKMIKKLLSRSVEMSLELERIFAKGIKVVTRASDNYPSRLKKVLKDLAPPVIFYCGNLELADKEGIAIVGSRKVEEEYVEFTKKLVKKATEENLIIFSGGAKGIDSISENEAFLQGNEYVSFLSDSLENKIKTKETRDRLSSGKILLMTANKPDTGFNVGLAMSRNKYVYSLSQGTFIIASDYNKGGTWTGAVENFKNKWVKSFVRVDNSLKGNKELIKMGCTQVDKIDNIRNLLECEIITQEIEQLDLMSINKIEEKEARYNNKDEILNSREKIEIIDNNDTREINDNIECLKFDLYNCIIETLLEVIKDDEKTLEEMVEILNVSKSQLSIWIKRATEENKIKKLSRPVRYICVH